MHNNSPAALSPLYHLLSKDLTNDKFCSLLRETLQNVVYASH